MTSFGLDLAAGAHAARALDAGVELNRHAGMAQIGCHRCAPSKPAAHRAPSFATSESSSQSGVIGARARPTCSSSSTIFCGAACTLAGGVAPACRAWARDSRTGRARARPRSPRCRRGSCRRRAGRPGSTDGESRCRGARPPAGWSRRAVRPASARRGKRDQLRISARVASPSSSSCGKWRSTDSRRIGRRLAQAADRGVHHGAGQFLAAADDPSAAAPSAAPPWRCRRGRACTCRRTRRRRSAWR